MVWKGKWNCVVWPRAGIMLIQALRLFKLTTGTFSPETKAATSKEWLLSLSEKTFFFGYRK